jgi:hypothetical protein
MFVFYISFGYLPTTILHRWLITITADIVIVKPKKKPEKVNKRDELSRELDDIRAAARNGH